VASTKTKLLKQPESVSDFKMKIRALMRGLPPDTISSFCGHARECVLRKPKHNRKAHK